MAGFIQFTDIEGESKDANHDAWINLISFTQPVSKPVVTGQAGSARTPGDTVAGDINVVMELDKSGPKLAAACCSGLRFDDVKIELTGSVGENKRSVYWTYELKKVYITSWDLDGDAQGDGTATQNLLLNAEEITWKYTEYGEDGTAKGDVEKSFNTSTGEVN